MSKDKTFWIVGGVFLVIGFLYYFSDTNRFSRKHFDDTKKLCERLSSNHPGVRGLNEECMIEATSIFEEGQESIPDDRDPYENARP